MIEKFTDNEIRELLIKFIGTSSELGIEFTDIIDIDIEDIDNFINFIRDNN